MGNEESSSLVIFWVFENVEMYDFQRQPEFGLESKLIFDSFSKYSNIAFRQ